MPRIRTVKPEFWQDDRIGTLSHGARLLALSVLNFADDKGRFKATVLRLKVFTFPYDESIRPEEVGKFLKELIGIRYLIEYSVNGETAYQIRSFLKHQQIQHPTKSRLPSPARIHVNEDSMNVHGALTDNSMEDQGSGKGKDQGKERKGKELKDLSGRAKRADTDPRVKTFVDWYFRRFVEITGTAYHVSGGKDGKTVKQLLGTFDLLELERRADAFLASRDPFVLKAGHTLGVFASMVNRFAPPPKGEVSPLKELADGFMAKVREREREAAG